MWRVWQGSTRAAAVASAAMAVRNRSSVRDAYAELSAQHSVPLPAEYIAALEPVAARVGEGFAINRWLLNQRGILGLDHASLLR